MLKQRKTSLATLGFEIHHLLRAEGKPMATLAGQRAQFTWALNQYNLKEDSEDRTYFARRMAKYIAAAPSHGFTVEQVTQGKSYPAAEVAKYLNDPMTMSEPDISDEKAEQLVSNIVDTSDVLHAGEGPTCLYASTDVRPID